MLQPLQGFREEWFPTSIWYFDDPQPQPSVQQWLDWLKAERQRDEAGMSGRSNVLGWHSRDTLHEEPIFAGLVQRIRQGIGQVFADFGLDSTKIEPRLSNCWAIVNSQYCSNVVHVHGNSFWSGVYYLQTPPDCGNLFFLDPRPMVHMMSLPQTQPSRLTFSRITYAPRVGRMLLFPSWLQHGVEPNLSQVDRICLSFNLAVRWL
ncbi:TIGR02466 family protein [Tuwongella immobilis]|uniref:Prolyl 4-hydroxylase alpha subunit Fe(2+) 2OG dioxygenase domain-containing protein n=1 Tax=Tuwongella immobilis TaxID=692036 RepID=A0A6C2YL63_9BACT|nr:TIGR02466 family protein [Tuwongella immobilis]VIP01853.1 Uncharacterized protein OS=Anabaena sp. 90 GN=ANA_C10777 PE=4 SV=1: 2OG-FeII_Oxy_5 [Tuwongella immobilis]VTR99647.1 Uncharacterized protein OS=Anabaena sp. 90 GN=ANA_C10777 PE=4 SV=1: 2OG-FeII_Oxy_5 [Tuwongella immobilis]